MKLSNRITGILGGGSDGWEVFNRARHMVAAGETVVELTIGDHDVITDALILDEMHRAAHAGHTGYASVPGTSALRDAIAARVTAQTDVPTTRDNVVVTSGGQPALYAAHAACCDPGDAALYLDPFYATYPGVIRALQAEPRAVLTRPEQDFQPQAADIVAAAADGRARSLLINTPNNPTGVVYRPETMAQIAQVCADKDLWLISDEVYDSQIWNGQHTSARSFDDIRDRTLIVNSMSKTFAMTGSRIGWVIGPEEVIEHLINLSTHMTYGVPGFIQDAALLALQQGPEFEAKIAAPFRRRREIAVRMVERSQVVRSVPADGAMYVMLDVRATGLSGEAFANALLDAEHIAVMPGESFGKAAAGHIRVALTVEDAKLQSALERLIAFAETLAEQAA